MKKLMILSLMLPLFALGATMTKLDYCNERRMTNDIILSDYGNEIELPKEAYVIFYSWHTPATEYESSDHYNYIIVLEKEIHLCQRLDKEKDLIMKNSEECTALTETKDTE